MAQDNTEKQTDDKNEIVIQLNLSELLEKQHTLITGKKYTLIVKQEPFIFSR